MVKVLELRNPSVAHVLRDLLVRASSNEAKATYVLQHVGEPWLTVLVALDPTPVGVVVIVWPNSPLTPLPQAGMLTANNAHTRRALIDATVAAMRERGYTSGQVINNTGKRDAVYLRAMRGAGKHTKTATVFEFEFGPSLGGTGEAAAWATSSEAAEAEAAANSKS